MTPGNHDGVHLGHRALVDAAKARAARDGLVTTAMFFDPHPTSLLAPERAPTLLTSPTRRVEILKGAGADEVFVMPFDEEFASLTPRAFAEKVLVETCGARCVVVGPDFHFGTKRSGNVQTLRALGEELGYDVIVVPPALFEGEPSSSTRIRKCLREGDVVAAAGMLTRVHEVTGKVVHGDHRHLSDAGAQRHQQIVRHGRRRGHGDHGRGRRRGSAQQQTVRGTRRGP